MAEPLNPLATVWAGRWHCARCRAPLARVQDAGGLLVTRTRARFVAVNNRGMLEVQCAACGLWAQWWQGAPHVTPSLETANA